MTKKAKKATKSFKKTYKKRMKKVTSVSSQKPMARWGTYWSWKITTNRLNPLSQLSVSDEWEKAEKTKKKNGKKKTVTYHRRAAAQITLEYDIYREFFGKSFNVLTHVNSWKKRLGKTGAFYVENKPLFSSKKFKLTKVEVSDIKTTGGVTKKSKGQALSATISLTFTEVKSSKTKSSVSKQKSLTTSKESKKTTAKKNAKKKGKK